MNGKMGSDLSKPRRGEYPELPELASNVALVLALWRANQLHFQVARQVVKGAVWWSSNVKGTCYKSRYWTHEAIRHQKEHPVWVKGNGLVNEHVIPRTCLEARLMELLEPSAESVRSVLNFSFTCLLTGPENSLLMGHLRSNMPKDWKWGGDPFERYRKVGITWCEPEVDPSTA